MKKCNKCKINKELYEFYLYPNGSPRGRCKKCYIIDNINSKNKNIETYNRYVNNNKEKISKKQKEWRSNNQDYMSDWRENNRERINMYSAQRRAKKKSDDVTTEEQWLINLLYLTKDLCNKTFGIEFEVDHIKPLSKGGMHTWNNIQIITKKENRRKGSKWEQKQKELIDS